MTTINVSGGTNAGWRRIKALKCFRCGFDRPGHVTLCPNCKRGLYYRVEDRPEE